jgi:hypothetical protein
MSLGGIGTEDVCYFCGGPGWHNPQDPAFTGYRDGLCLFTVWPNGEDIQAHGDCLERAGWEYDFAPDMKGSGWTSPREQARS